MRKKTVEEFIKDSINKHGDIYVYSKVDYKNNKTKVKIICKEHGEFEQRPDDHLNGHGCSKCVKKHKKDLEEFVKESVEKHGNLYEYSLVSYKNIHSKVSIMCKKHGVFYQVAHNHLQGQGCPKCYGNKKLKNDDILEKFKEEHKDKYDYSLVNYHNNRTKVEIICKTHGIFKQNVKNHIQGQGCPKCKNIISKPEIELQNFIKCLDFDIISNNRKILNGKELDIYIPSLNKAIEFNGKYWHYGRNFIPGKHALKSNLCREKGIKLLHIREDLWIKDKEKMKNIIKEFLEKKYII